MFRRRSIQIGAAFLAIVCGFLSTARAQPVGLEGYQVLEVELCNQGDIETIKALENANPELEIWSDRVDIGLVDVRLSPEQAQLLEEVGFDYEIRVEDLQQLYDELFPGPSADDFFDAYRSYDEHLAFMQGLVADYPDQATMVDLGPSVLGRRLWAIRVTGRGKNKPAVIYHGAQHGNEIIGSCVVAYTARYLLSNYDSDPDIKTLVDNVEWYLLPIMNPDGYERGGRYNANGVDLNRDWADPDGNPPRFTQPETRALRDFFRDHPNSRAHTDFHSYGRMIMWPWSYIGSRCEDDKTFDLLGAEMADRIRSIRGTDYRRGALCVVFGLCVSGSSVDYTYGAVGQWGTGFEVGYSHNMPTREIVPTSQEMLEVMLVLTEFINDCNGNRVPDWKDIARGRSPDKNGNRTPDECEFPVCSFGEKIKNPKCRLKRGVNKMAVKLKGGVENDTFTVELSNGQKREGTLNQEGKGKAKFRKLPSGPGTATAAWGCGAKDHKDYLCP